MNSDTFAQGIEAARRRLASLTQRAGGSAEQRLVVGVLGHDVVAAQLGVGFSRSDIEGTGIAIGGHGHVEVGTHGLGRELVLDESAK